MNIISSVIREITAEDIRNATITIKVPNQHIVVLKAPAIVSSIIDKGADTIVETNFVGYEPEEMLHVIKSMINAFRSMTDTKGINNLCDLLCLTIQEIMDKEGVVDDTTLV